MFQRLLNGKKLSLMKICHTISNIMQSNLTVRKSVYKLLWAYYNNLSFTSIKHEEILSHPGLSI